MKRITSITVVATTIGLLAAVAALPARADAIYCSGFAAGYKAAYCSKAVRMSSCDPKGIECSSLGGDGYASGYMDGQRVGTAAAAKDLEDRKAASSEKSGAH